MNLHGIEPILQRMGEYIRRIAVKLPADGRCDVGLSDAEKEPIKAAIEHLKEVNKGSDVAAIKTAIEDAQKAFYPVAEKLYQQANPQGDANCGGDCGNCGSDGVVDADYETVD